MPKDWISYVSFVACRFNGKCFYHYYCWIIISFVIKLRNAESRMHHALISQHSITKKVFHKADDGNKKEEIKFIFAWKNMRTLKR